MLTRPLRMRDLVAPSAVLLAVACMFVFDPFGMDRWVFPKELILVLAAMLTVLAAPLGRTPRWWRWWAGGASVVVALAVALSSAPWAQLSGRWPRYEGIVTLGAYALAFGVGARLLGGERGAEETKRRSRLFHETLAFALVIAAVIAALEVSGLRPVASDLDRPGSLLGNASDMGIVGVIGLSLFLPRAAETMDRRTVVGAIVGTVSSIALVALSGSRGALIGAAVSVVVSVAIALTRKTRASRQQVAVFGGAVALTVVAGAIATATRVTTAGEVAAASADNRWELWRSTVELISPRLLTGVGPSGFSDAITLVLSPTWYAETGLGRWIESPHSLPLQIVAAGGGIGVALVLALIALAARHGRRTGLRGPFGASGVASLVAASAALLFHFTAPGTVLLLALVAGATFAVPVGSPVIRTRAPMVAALAALGLWAVLLASAIVSDHRLRDGFERLDAGDSEAAEVAFEHAVALRGWDPDLPLMIAERAANEIERSGSANVVPRAAEWADRAVLSLPSSTRALKARAVIAQYSGDFDTAIASLERAAHLSPTDPQVFHRLGGIEYLAGRADAARADLQRARDLAPDDPEIIATWEYVFSATSP